MAEMTAEEARKDLQAMVDKAKAGKEKEKLQTMSEEEKKTLEETKKKEQEEKVAKEAEAKKQSELLAKKDEELTKEEKDLKVKLVEEKTKEEESKLSVEDKLKRIKEQSQKRIDEVLNELKQVKDKSSKEYEALQTEHKLLRQDNENLNKKLTKPAEDNDPVVILKNKETERISKFLEEDKSKPRSERREMTDEEWEEWNLESPRAASRWEAQQELRRSRERLADINNFQKEKNTKEFSEKMQESSAKTLIKHPELDTTKREAELKAQGKSNEEIHATLCQENEKYRICAEIVKANPGKYYTNPNGPELVTQEMEKRIANKSTDTKTEAEKKAEELTKKVEDLETELASLKNSDTGITSTVTKKKETADLSEAEKDLVKVMKELKLPQANIDAALKSYREKKKE